MAPSARQDVGQLHTPDLQRSKHLRAWARGARGQPPAPGGVGWGWGSADAEDAAHPLSQPATKGFGAASSERGSGDPFWPSAPR